MKKLLLILFLASVFSSGVFAQVDTIHLKNNGGSGYRKMVTDRPPQAIYFGIGGSGPIFSVNYDSRFGKRLNGAGFTAGLGFFGVTGATLFSIPVSVNYLFGKQNHFLELAAGATFATGSSYDFVDNGSSSASTVFGHINLGYRYQPAIGGFFARTGVSPLFIAGEYVTSYYLGLGYSF
jgi:hypothetical protein